MTGTEHSPAALDAGALDRIAATYHEPDWLQAIRRAAWDRYDSMPMPARTDERWRRTDLRALDMNRVRPHDETARLDLETGFAGPEDSPRDWAAAREELRAQGVIFAPFSAALRENPDFFRRLLEEGPATPNATLTRLEGGIPANADKFEALARAVGADGYAVYVPRGADVAIPLRAHSVAQEPSLATQEYEPSPMTADLGAALSSRNVSSCVFPRSIIVAERGSRVTVVEDFTAREGAGPYFSAGLTEVFVGEGAEVTIVSAQQWGAETWNFHTQRSYVERDGRIVTLSVQLGGKVSKVNVEGSLIGPNAQSRMLGLLFGEQKQHFDLYTLQDHQADATTSDLLFKNALRDEAKSIYSGLIRVDEGVMGADAYQSNRNLLLSEKAKADSQPMLEILNNEVRCTHGASMGPVDPEHLFYLQARGLTEAEAERMVVQGFFEEALADIRDEETRLWLHDAIAQRIGGVW